MFLHKYVVSLVLLAIMLKYSRFKIHIPVEYLIYKRNYLEQKIRAENWILHKHLHQAKNATVHNSKLRKKPTCVV